MTLQTTSLLYHAMTCYVVMKTVARKTDTQDLHRLRKPDFLIDAMQWESLLATKNWGLPTAYLQAALTRSCVLFLAVL